MSLRQTCLVLLAVSLAANAAAAEPPLDWPEGIDPASHPDPRSGALALLGGDLGDGNYGGGGVRADGALHHIAGRHFEAGEGWWVMACRNEDCRLVPAALQVEDLPHGTYGGPMVPGQRLRLQTPASEAWFMQRPQGDVEKGTRSRQADEVVILAVLKPAGELAALPLQPGELRTWWYAEPRPGDHPPAPAYSRNRLAAAESQIRIADVYAEDAPLLTLRQRPPASTEVPAAALEIEFAGVRQSLGERTLHLVSETYPVELGEMLQWVGDLDGDGRPDLLVNHSGYFWDVALWLSSLAKPGELVGEAGRFTFAPPNSPGC